MNNYSDDYLDELELAEEQFDIDDRVIKEFRKDSRQKKQNFKKKINKVKIDDEKE